MRSRSLAAIASVLLVGAGGCGSSGSAGSGAPASRTVDPNGAEVNPAGDIPDDQVFVRYAPPGAGYSVKVPEGWSRSTSGGAVSFTDKLNTVRLEHASASAPPAVAGATTVKRAGTTALRTISEQKGKPDPVTGKSVKQAIERYVYFRRGKVAIVTLLAPKGADNVDPWRIVTDSLRWQ